MAGCAGQVGGGETMIKGARELRAPPCSIAHAVCPSSNTAPQYVPPPPLTPTRVYVDG